MQLHSKDAIDHDIADHLHRRGSWSKKHLRDMVDSTIFRRDPELVHEDRAAANDKRGVWLKRHQERSRNRRTREPG